MNLISRLTCRLVAVAALLNLTGCQHRVTLVGNEEDLIVLNGCVISAVNYLAVVKTQHSLEQNYWAQILLVRFSNNSAGHAYTVWETQGNIYGYDRNSGSFTLPVYTRDARSIAIVLAQELSKVLKKPLVVESAEFVNSKEAQLYEFGSMSRPNSSMGLATAFGAMSIVDPGR